MEHVVPRGFAHASLALLLTAPLGAQIEITHGPFVGHTTATAVTVWVRASGPAELTLHVLATAERPPRSATAATTEENDFCVALHVDGLSASRTYTYRIESAGRTLVGDESSRFTTAPAPDAKARVRIAFGSCAKEDEGTSGTWRRIGIEKPGAVVLLGDTPYIDNTDLTVQRRRYRAFAAVDAMAAVLRSTPWYGTWDDHDFGRNDTDGRLPEKANSRRAFVEYHANPSYGEDDRGIYTSFRRGPVEVFLLDTRWFAATEPSPFRAHAASLLGARQWRWLLDGLRASTAPFKILACGMIWNPATRPGKLDHWGSYELERGALFAHLKKHAIGGVTLVGGDIHRSRVLRHATADVAGYDITELITSPMHDSIIVAANAPHPDLVEDMGEPHCFLMLEADTTVDPATLRARFVNSAGDDVFVHPIWPE